MGIFGFIPKGIENGSLVFCTRFFNRLREFGKSSFPQRPYASASRAFGINGPAPLMTKIMDLLMNMNRMIDRDFEAGLANLKARVKALQIPVPDRIFRSTGDRLI